MPLLSCSSSLSESELSSFLSRSSLILLLVLLVSRTARWVIEKRNEMEIRLCENKIEGRDLPTFLSPPLIKFMHFNWSKLNFAFSFFFFSFYFYLFLFISFLICFYSFYLFIFFFLSLWLFWPFALLLRVYYLSTDIIPCYNTIGLYITNNNL